VLNAAADRYLFPVSLDWFGTSSQVGDPRL
jgi:hypothetical protein